MRYQPAASSKIEQTSGAMGVECESPGRMNDLVLFEPMITKSSVSGKWFATDITSPVCAPSQIASGSLVDGE